MKFKIDENLPEECGALLRDAGFEADTVGDERLAGADDAVIAIRSQEEDRVLVTLDLDAVPRRDNDAAQTVCLTDLRSSAFIGG